MPLRIKRIYAPADPADGDRILVDRLWPRGVSKERAALTLWMKEIAPGIDLRKWFAHRPDRMDAFADAYRQELETDPEKQRAVADLLERARKENVTLLYGAKDPKVNHAIVLEDYLLGKQA